MNYRIYRQSDFQVQPWKNGQGSTTQLWVLPADDDGFLLRISIAAVKQSGPFSQFTGYDRTIIQLTGSPMTLRHAGGPAQMLQLLVPYEFSGDVQTDCTLAGEAEDYNVMVRRGVLATRTDVAALQPDGEGINVSVGQAAAVFCLQGAMVLAARQQAVPVAAGELLHLAANGVREQHLHAAAPDTRAIVTFWQSVAKSQRNSTP